MMSLFSRPKAAPAQKGKRANGTNRNTVNEAQRKLAIALNNIASQHVNKYANAIRASAKANANAARATAVAAVEPTQPNVAKAVNAVNNAALAQQNVKEAEKAAAAVVSAATLNVNKLIENINATNNLNKFVINRKNNMNKVPANRKNKVNLALARRRAALLRVN